MKKFFALLSVVALLGTGCIMPSKPTSPAADFLKGDWKMTSTDVYNDPFDASKLNLTISFDGQKMTGKLCNSLSGNYTVGTSADGQSITLDFGPITATKIFCQGPAGDIEDVFTRLITGDNLGAPTVSQDKQGNLIIQGGEVNTMFRFERGR